MNRPNQIRELFQGALEREGRDRFSWLEDHCSRDPSLLDEVKTLLTAHERAPRTLDEPILHLRRLARIDKLIPTDPATESLPGTMVGAYRLIRPLGSGGMGVVWLGERADGLYERKVAIKFIRCLGPTEWMDRFRTEQRALAALDHPYIARLLDAGNTGAGLPYFVMEHVVGARIDEYCVQRDLSPNDRLQLFRKVCEAVEYAHRNLVIHRDIKPSNILVDSQGTPKLLDFGIAKLLNQTGSASTDQTWTLGQSFTPEYASPEQILGEPVTTGTDVFSLGAVLYELLTGQKRFPWSKDSPTPLRDLINQRAEASSHLAPHHRPSLEARQSPSTDPNLRKGTEDSTNAEKPNWSSVTRSLGKAENTYYPLHGEVELILLKALKPETDQRYSSVEQFSEDIRRHLSRLPILARPDTRRYRTYKFIQRHRAGAVAVLVAILGLVGTTVGTSIGLLHAHRSRQEALRQAERARSAGQLAEDRLTEMIEARDDARVQAERYRREGLKSQQITAFLREMITSADPFSGMHSGMTVREMLDGAAARLEVQLADYPEVEAELHATLGETYLTLGLTDQSEKHWRRALELRRLVFGEDHLTVADTLVALSKVLIKSGNPTLAISLLKSSVNIRRASLGDHVEVALAEANLAAASHQVGDLTSAENLYRDVLPILRKQLGPDHPKAAQCLLGLGGVLSQSGDFESATAVYREAAAIHGPLGQADPQLAVDAFVHLSHSIHNQGDLPASEAVCREALDRSKQLLGNEHPTVASILRDLAYLRYEQGHIDEALELYQESLNMLRLFNDEDDVGVADCVRGVAGMLWAQGRYAAAEAKFREYLALEQSRATDGPSPRIAVAYNSLGVVLRDAGRYSEAEPLLHTTLDLHRQLYGESHRTVAYAHINLARLNYLTNNLISARDHCTQSINIHPVSLPRDHPDMAECHLVLGMILSAEGRPLEAESYLRDAADARLRVFGPDHWLVAETSSALGECLLKLGRFAEAKELLDSSLEILDAKVGLGHILRRLTLKRLIDLSNATHDYEAASAWQELYESAELAASSPSSVLSTDR